MVQNNPINKLKLLLLPISFIYGIIISIRHKLFDWKIIKETQFSLPVICVGNIAMGGTGKTPHIEYLIKLIKEKANIAMLSRGYKRSTTGYYLANKKATPDIIGDEPFQVYQKFNTMVAVCEKRVDGITNLLKEHKKPEAILLDDAFQHRYIKAGLNIVLIDYSNPVFKDFLFPAGYLRDTKSQLKRAHIIIITKCPEDLNKTEYNYWHKKLRLNENQQLFFSSIDYDMPQAVFSIKEKAFTLSDLKKENASILLISGIANPKPLEDYLKQYKLNYQLLQFPDHHNFSSKDLQKIKTCFESIAGRKKLILTTEKDAVRFKHTSSFPRNLKDKIYYLPIKINLLNDYQNNFDKTILTYVTENK